MEKEPVGESEDYRKLAARLQERIDRALGIDPWPTDPPLQENCPLCGSDRWGRSPDDRSGIVCCGNCNDLYQRFVRSMEIDEYEEAVHEALLGLEEERERAELARLKAKYEGSE